MKQNISEILQRQLLLMGYKSNNTLSENLEQIKNKPFIVEQGAADRYTNYINSEQGLEQHDIDQANKMANTYPNYCRYPDKTLPLPPNKFGATGEDAVPKKMVEGQLVKFCYYESSSSSPNGAGIFLPSDSEITFWDNDGIFYVLNKWVEKRPNDLQPNGPLTHEGLEENFRRILKINSVWAFKIGLTDYKVRLRWYPDLQTWEFSGYANKDNVFYQNPELNDDRNAWDKFIDDWGTVLQITAALATAIAGALTGGAAWVLTAEIIVELGLGLIVAQRELEKGENVSATFSVIFGLLPMLKLTKFFRGVSPETFRSLADKLSKANLNVNSTVDDYVKFYQKLNPEQQKLMTQLLEQDEITRNQMFKEISVNLNKFQKGEMLEAGLKDMIIKRPDVLKDLSFFEKLWVRELSANVGTVAVYGIIKLVFGDKWDDATKKESAKIYTVIPERLKKELTYNLISNAEKSEQIVNIFHEALTQDKYKIEKDAKNLLDYQRELESKSVNSAGGEYTKIEDETNNQQNINFETLDLTEEEIKNQGWSPFGYEGLEKLNEGDGSEMSNYQIAIIGEYLYYKKK